MDATATISAKGTTPLYAAVSMTATASIAVVGKIEQFVDTEEFIVYINTDIGKVASINTAESVDGNIETLRIFEG
jgi:hypothetical protein